MQLALNEGKAYSKAYEMYIKSHGSPLWHVPPRPVIEPAINDNKKEIAKRLIAAYGKAMENIYAWVIVCRHGAPGSYVELVSSEWTYGSIQ